MYKNKYLKYKRKYLDLKNRYGGAAAEEVAAVEEAESAYHLEDQPKGTFGDSIYHVKDGESHINGVIQNLILTFYYNEQLSRVLGEYITHAQIIAQQVSRNVPNQDGTFNPLIWRALDKCYNDIPRNHIESYQENVRSFNAANDTKFEEHVDKLSKLKGWCEYARYILINLNMDKFNGEDIPDESSNPLLINKYKEIINNSNLFNETKSKLTGEDFRKDFLKQQLVKVPSGNENLYHLNSGYHEFKNSPKSTVFHGYTNGVRNISYLTVKFNEHFNTPSLQNKFGPNVSFYFNVQKFDAKKIKPHYVLVDDIPAVFDGNLFYSEQVSHGISEELQNLEVLNENQAVHIHDSNISPDNGHYLSAKFIGPTKESPANFWSIVKFNDKSYITFHLICFNKKLEPTELDIEDIKKILGESNTLDDFLNNIEIRPYLNKLFEFFNE